MQRREVSSVAELSNPSVTTNRHKVEIMLNCFHFCWKQNSTTSSELSAVMSGFFVFRVALLRGKTSLILVWLYSAGVESLKLTSIALQPTCADGAGLFFLILLSYSSFLSTSWSLFFHSDLHRSHQRSNYGVTWHHNNFNQQSGTFTDCICIT